MERLLGKNCPNVVTIHDIWTESVVNEKLYIQMDWVGTTLQDLLALNWRFEGPYWFDLAWAIAHGVSQAHQYGIIHGDLNPANGLSPHKALIENIKYASRSSIVILFQE